MGEKVIRENAIEKKAYGLWLENRIKTEKHKITLDLEQLTDRVKDIFHEQVPMILGLSPETDEMILYFMDTFLTMESFFMNHIEHSQMARDSLNRRMKLELEDKNILNSSRDLTAMPLSARRIL